MSDLKEKIKAAIESNLSTSYYDKDINGMDEGVEDLSKVAERHAQERAVAFAEYCDKNGWYRVADNIWVSDEYPEMSKGKISSKDLYQLFDNETKQK